MIVVATVLHADCRVPAELVEVPVVSGFADWLRSLGVTSWYDAKDIA